jgi:mRNA interferase MazF
MMSQQRTHRYISRGEVWDVELSPSQGTEIAKTRPCVVISHDQIGKLPLRVVVPVTSWKDSYSRAIWMVKLEPTTTNGLDKVSAADAFQIRSVSINRFRTRREVLSNRDLADITAAVGIVINIGV